MFYPHRTGNYTSLPCVNVPDKEVCIFHKISDSAPQAAVYHDPQWCTKHTMDNTAKCLSDKKALKKEDISEIHYIGNLEKTLDFVPAYVRTPWMISGMGILYGKK